MAMMGVRSASSPTVAGSARNRMPRSVSARLARIAPRSPRAAMPENAGSAAMAMACAMITCGMLKICQA
jgi:hypothetical protein